ncbi:MAG: Rpn family recombination-promoting nuclease/putative transposase [Anaeroplasmataceae bacterium]|nr:Rpn family recombination-promoting nuclease/putative transposase [Anaeroplasmataceae bacterium]
MEKFEVKYTGTNDFIFKTIFQNKRILSSYLKLLDVDIKPEEIIYENAECKEGLKIKAVRFDIRIRATHTSVDIEAQRKKIGKDNSYHRRRKIHYLCVLHGRAYGPGEEYNEERKSKVIFFLDHNIEGRDEIQRTKLINTSTDEVYDEVEIIDVVLGKKRGDESVRDKMLNVLKEKDLTKYYGEEGIVGGVAKMIFELNKEECQRRAMECIEEVNKSLKKKYNEGYYTGQQKGNARGKREANLSTAKRLKMMGSTDEFIAEATGLSLKQVKKLL